MAKSKKKDIDTKSAEKNSPEESLAKEEHLSEEKSSENDVENEILERFDFTQFPKKRRWVY